MNNGFKKPTKRKLHERFLFIEDVRIMLCG